MTRQEYDALPGVNWSTLKHMARSPAHYRYWLEHERPDTDALRRGRAVHVATFEPMRFAREYAIWDGARRAGKDWDRFCEENGGREILTEKQAAEVEEIAAAVRADPVAAKYLGGGRGEQTIRWTYWRPATDGFPEQKFECKGRLDWLRTDCIVDLKTSKTAEPTGFGHEAFRYGYHTQAAWYADGYAMATGKRLPVVLVVVEATPPHVVSVFKIPDAYMELGRETYRGLLNRLDWCRREDQWPAYLDDVAELTLPRWAMPYDPEEDAGALGLEGIDAA